MFQTLLTTRRVLLVLRMLEISEHLKAIETNPRANFNLVYSQGYTLSLLLKEVEGAIEKHQAENCPAPTPIRPERSVTEKVKECEHCGGAAGYHFEYCKRGLV
jgi:hypothetical protein